MAIFFYPPHPKMWKIFWCILQKLSWMKFFVSNIFIGNGLVPSDMPPIFWKKTHFCKIFIVPEPPSYLDSTSVQAQHFPALAGSQGERVASQQNPRVYSELFHPDVTFGNLLLSISSRYFRKIVILSHFRLVCLALDKQRAPV